MMSLLTIERSSSLDGLNQLNDDVDVDGEEIDEELREEIFTRSRTSSFEGFIVSKGAAYAIPDGDFARQETQDGGELHSHLQGMVDLLQDEDAVRLIVKLETAAEYTRYLSIVTSYGTSDEEESILLGFDWVNEEVTIGLVIPLWCHVTIELDGDGGFKVKTGFRDYVFKPVSVQTMWTALQWINKCLATAHRGNHHPKGLSHAWIGYYKNRISSPREFINYWESMDDIWNKRDVSLDYFDKVKTDQELLRRLIRHKLKEILKRFDLEEVTCRQVRNVLEAEMKMSLNHLKGFVDEQMFIVVGQMDSSTKITDRIFLGSEWNASNLQELKENGVGYILNITKEIDNFFPGNFEYMNIRIFDEKEANLLKHWGKTYRFLHEAQEKGLAALVHCRRGISRSASTVVAFLMKEHHLTLHDAMKLVKSKRSIVEPNAGFWKQLIVYEGILKSSRHRDDFIFRQRINSDTTNRRSRKKSQRQKKEMCSETDHVDGTPEHAHTFPRMTPHDATLLLPGETSETATNSSVPAESSPETSDAASENEASDSESETSLTGRKMQRTRSEPNMKPLERQCYDYLTIDIKDRAKSFTEHYRNSKRQDDSDSCGLKLPIWGTERKQDDTVCMDTTETHETKPRFDDETEQSPDAETRAFLGTAEEQVDVVTNALPARLTDGENGAAEEEVNQSVFVDSAADGNGKSPVADDVETIGPETKGCTIVGDHDSIELTRGDLQDDGERSRGTHRPRSRSIGEKLEGKLLQKQGKSENSENLKKVEGRGRVKRRERKSKSDLQLSNYGFVERHTKIIEEQMLHSMLRSSEKSLVTSETGISANETGISANETGISANETQAMEDGEMPAVDSMLSPGENCEKNSEEKEKSDKSNEEKKNEKEEKEKSDKSNEEKKNEKNNEEEKTAENGVDKEKSSEIHNIVQEVNAEAKRDIQGQADASWLPLVVQRDPASDTQGNDDDDDVCIDEMAWIDLTHHHRDVVKRKSAAFENMSEELNRTTVTTENSCRKDKQDEETGENLGRPREELETDKCFSPEVDEKSSPGIPRDDVNAEVVLTSNDRECCIERLDQEVLKLDLGELDEDEIFSETPRSSYSIVVEDYRVWEASSVRERTKILENIVSKNGGSFPSPRSSRTTKQEEEEVQSPDDATFEVNRLLSSSSEIVESHHGESLQDEEEFQERRRSSSCPVNNSLSLNEDETFGEEMVRVLVDKFEQKNGE